MATGKPSDYILVIEFKCWFYLFGFVSILLFCKSIFGKFEIQISNHFAANNNKVGDKFKLKKKMMNTINLEFIQTWVVSLCLEIIYMSVRTMSIVQYAYTLACHFGISPLAWPQIDIAVICRKDLNFSLV